MDADTLDEGLRALAHPDRRTFVRACLSEHRAAGELAALSNLSLATVSEHLKVLRKTGLLQVDRQGRFWLYRSDPAVLKAIAEAVEALGRDGEEPSPP